LIVSTVFRNHHIRHFYFPAKVASRVSVVVHLEVPKVTEQAGVIAQFDEVSAAVAWFHIGGHGRLKWCALRVLHDLWRLLREEERNKTQALLNARREKQT